MAFGSLPVFCCMLGTSIVCVSRGLNNVCVSRGLDNICVSHALYIHLNIFIMVRIVSLIVSIVV